jgi:hypothetical protein
MTNEVQTLSSVLKSYSQKRLDVLMQHLTPAQLSEIADYLEQEKLQHVWDSMGRRQTSFESGPLLWLTKYAQTEDMHWMATIAALLRKGAKRHNYRFRRQ